MACSCRDSATEEEEPRGEKRHVLGQRVVAGGRKPLNALLHACEVIMKPHCLTAAQNVMQTCAGKKSHLHEEPPAAPVSPSQMSLWDLCRYILPFLWSNRTTRKQELVGRNPVAVMILGEHLQAEWMSPFPRKAAAGWASPICPASLHTLLPSSSFRSRFSLVLSALKPGEGSNAHRQTS